MGNHEFLPMLFPKKPKIYLIVEENLSLSVFLDLLKKCPKGIQFFVDVKHKWQFLHSIAGVKQIKEAAEHLEIFFLIKNDSIAEKLLESVNIPLAEEIPEDAKNFYTELSPDKKFQMNKIGEAFSSQEFEIVKVIHKTGEEQVAKIYNEVQGLSLKNKLLLGIFVILSVGILGFLLALVAPSATIEISAGKKMISAITNINFIKSHKSFSQDIPNKGNNFNLYPLEFRFEHAMDFPVLSKIFEGQNAFGDITLYNNYNEDITLRNGTKIQTAEGLIFVTKHYVRVPSIKRVKNKEGKTVLEPGSALVNVQANDFDLYQEVIGSRGNILPQKFTIPGLTHYMQKFVWGESVAPFRGGTTRWRMEVQQSDLDAASEKMKKLLFAKAEENITKYINEQNMLMQNKIALFPLKDYIKEEVSKITIDPKILGQNIEMFSVKGEMLVSAYVFSQKYFYDFLQSHIDKKRDPAMKIETIDFATMALRKFEETPSEIRVAVDIQGRQSYEIDENSEAGKKFQTTMKEQIRGMSIEDAFKFISNRDEVGAVDISVWPPVKKSLPMIRKNIQIIEK